MVDLFETRRNISDPKQSVYSLTFVNKMLLIGETATVQPRLFATVISQFTQKI
jgi:hypothetical protein